MTHHRPHLQPPPLDIFYPVTPHRSVVDAGRVFSALRHRLGCVPTGERGPAGEYWITPKGVRFPVSDPRREREKASVVAVLGPRPLCYSYDYACALLMYASWLVAFAVLEETVTQPSEPELPPVRASAPQDVLRRPTYAVADSLFV